MRRQRGGVPDGGYRADCAAGKSAFERREDDLRVALSGVAFLGGMAFGQGLPADFLFSRMQVRVAPVLGIPLMVLVGIVTVITMGRTTPSSPRRLPTRLRWRM